MELLDAILLGALQGVTEFLPISSSGHLVLAQHFLGFAEDTGAKEIFFDGMLHLGTLLAVLAYFAGDLRKQMKNVLRETAGGESANGETIADPAAWPTSWRHLLQLG